MAERIIERCANDPRILVRCPDPRLLKTCGGGAPGNLCYNLSFNYFAPFYATITNVSACGFTASGNAYVLSLPGGGDAQGAVYPSFGFSAGANWPWIHAVSAYSCGQVDQRPVCYNPRPDDDCVQGCDRIGGGFGLSGRFQQEIERRADGSIARVVFRDFLFMYQQKTVVYEQPSGSFLINADTCCWVVPFSPFSDDEVPYAHWMPLTSDNLIVLPEGADICDHAEAVPYVGTIELTVFLVPPNGVNITDLSAAGLNALIFDHPDWWGARYSITPTVTYDGYCNGGAYNFQLVNVHMAPQPIGGAHAYLGSTPELFRQFNFRIFANASCSTPPIQNVPHGFPQDGDVVCATTYYVLPGAESPVWVNSFAGEIDIAQMNISGTDAP